MRQYPVKKIIKHLEDSDIFHDYEDFECFDTIYHEEITFLEPIICKQDLTAFIVNMAIMYVNQGLIYAKNKLSVKVFDNYMIWFEVEKYKEFFDEDHFHFTKVNFTHRASKIFSWLLVHPIDIKKDDSEFYELIKDVIGINDFCCYAQYDFDGDAYYHFVPKCFVEKYSSSSEK